MVWRGIAARRLLSLTTFSLTVLVVSGTLVAVSFSRLTAVSRGSAGALVLLGFVALAAQSVESVRRREPEIALARLRGRRGLRLLAFAVAEPCFVVIAGAVVGAVVGWLLTRLVVGTWLPSGTTASLGRPERTSLALVTLGILILVVVACWGVVRAPLLDQLAGGRRPRASTTFGLFLQVLLVLGAVVSVYQAHQASSSRVDWVTLVSPALVGLAGGQVMSWIVLAVLAIVVPHNRSARVGWFLTLRRLLRRADSLAVVRIVVAAGVVFGVAASAAIAAHNWRDDRARLQVGAPVSYPVEAGALRAYAAANSADPQRRWLLPVASYVSSAEGPDRRVFVAADRWQPVVGDFFAGTPSAPLTNEVRSIAGPAPRIGVGGEMSATFVTSTLVGTRGMNLGFWYVDDAGDSAEAKLALRPGRGEPAGPGLTRISGHAPGCRYACTVFEIDIGGLTQAAHQPGSPLKLVDATFAGLELLGEATGIELTGRQLGLQLIRDGASLEVTTSFFSFSNTWTLGSFRSTEVEKAVTTGGFASETSHGHPTVTGIDGVPREVSYVASVPVLPFVGTQGSALDLGRMLAGSGGSIPDTQAMVLARSDTPATVIAALRATHAVGHPTTYDRVVHRLGATPQAQGTRLYVLVAGFAGLIALVSIGSALAQQTGERRREAASLRSVGVRARAVSGAYRREALVLAVTTFVGTTLAAWVACRALLPALPLVSGWEFAPPLDSTPQLSFITLSALVAGAVVGVVTYVAFRGVGRTSPPRILREEPS